MGDRSSSLWAPPAESSARLSAAVADAAGAAETAGHLLRPMKRVSGVARLLRSSRFLCCSHQQPPQFKVRARTAEASSTQPLKTFFWHFCFALRPALAFVIVKSLAKRFVAAPSSKQRACRQLKCCPAMNGCVFASNDLGFKKHAVLFRSYSQYRLCI